jgi:hypothetical protein
VTPDPATVRFLRAAVKSGLRLQQAEAETGPGRTMGGGVRTLQRIKASLKKKKPQQQATL